MKMGKLLLAVFCAVALAGSFACQRKSTEPTMQETQPTPAQPAPAQPAAPGEGTPGGQQQGQ